MFIKINNNTYNTATIYEIRRLSTYDSNSVDVYFIDGEFENLARDQGMALFYTLNKHKSFIQCSNRLFNIDNIVSIKSSSTSNDSYYNKTIIFTNGITENITNEDYLSIHNELKAKNMYGEL